MKHKKSSYQLVVAILELPIWFLLWGILKAIGINIELHFILTAAILHLITVFCIWPVFKFFGIKHIKIRYALAAAIMAALAVFFIWPVLKVIGDGFYDRDGLTTWWIVRVFTDPSMRQWLMNSVAMACWSTAASMAIGVVLALLSDRVNFRGKRLAAALIPVTMILPPFVGALAFQKIFAHDWGIVNLLLEKLSLGKIDFFGGEHKFWMIVLLQALHLYPVAYLNASAALANIDPTLAQAARGLGASRWRVLRMITAPLARPGLFAGATIIFIWCFCEFGAPLMFGYEGLLAVRIYDGLSDQATPTQTYAMVFVLMSSAVGMYVAGRVLFGRDAAATESRGSYSEHQPPATALATVGCWAVFGLVTIAALMPHAVVILQSISLQWHDTLLPSEYTFANLTAVFRDERTWSSILNSLRYSAMATFCCALMGVAVAYLVVRLKLRGGSLLDSLAMAPLAVPGLVMAAGYVAITARGTFLEAIGPAQDPTVILVAAYTIRRLPYMVRSVSAGLQQTPPALELAARNLGSSQLGAIWRITIPLIIANIMAGALLTFAFNMLEVSDSLILAQTQDYYPITKQLYSLATGSQRPLAAALGVYGMALLGVTMLTVNLLLGKKMGRLFRV